MNQLSKALGRWLFFLYRCSVCNKAMNIHEGLVLDPTDSNRVIHKGCKGEKNSNYKKSVRETERSI